MLFFLKYEKDEIFVFRWKVIPSNSIYKYRLYEKKNLDAFVYYLKKVFDIVK